MSFYKLTSLCYKVILNVTMHVLLKVYFMFAAYGVVFNLLRIL